MKFPPIWRRQHKWAMTHMKNPTRYSDAEGPGKQQPRFKPLRLMFPQRWNAQRMQKAASRASSSAAQWAVPGEEAKRGAGLLFFAYGGRGVEVNRFLGEVMVAARSFRASNPSLPIAIVSNNETVDRSLFSHHIKPREDLLFPGSSCQGNVCRGDRLQRQWMTRLYYMALSPFYVTWALDSNTIQCAGASAHLAVQHFLDDALATSLWGYDLSHANGAKGRHIYPHNWNLLYRWTPQTSNVFRDWFLLLLRRGISADDQGPLAHAEVRQMLAGGGLRLGQVPTEFAAAFYSPFGKTFYPRTSRVVRGAVQILHVSPPSLAPHWCAAFNRDAGRPRQMVLLEPNNATGGDDINASKSLLPFALFELDNVSACTAALAVGKGDGHTPTRPLRRCPYQREWRQGRTNFGPFGKAFGGAAGYRPRMLPAELPTSYKMNY